MSIVSVGSLLSYFLPLPLEVGRETERVRWTFLPSNGCRRINRTPAGDKGEGSNAFQLIDLNPLILTFSRREKGPTTFLEKLRRALLSRDRVRFNFE